MQDLAEAEEIAGRGPMKLHQADVLLNRARLRLGWRLRGLVSDPKLISLEDIRRNPEMADLEAALRREEDGNPA